MQIESLEVFCNVARNRSFSRAALVKGITQSAVSQMVAKMEDDMKVQLIDRSTRPLQLTPLGKTFYDGCQEILAQFHELVASLQSEQARVDGTVQIAAIYSVGLGNMGQYVKDFMAQAPNAEVTIEYLHPDQVYEKVLEGNVDIGLVSFPRKMAKLSIIPWRDEPMVLTCAANHPLAKKKTVVVNDFDHLRYIHFSKELGIRRELDRFFRSKKVFVNVALEFDNVENIKQAVEIGAGVALLPEPTLRKEIADGSLVGRPLADCQFVRPLGIIHRKQNKLTGAAQEFLDLLRKRKNDVDSSELLEGSHAAGTDHKRPNGSLNNNHPTNGTLPPGKKRNRKVAT